MFVDVGGNAQWLVPVTVSTASSPEEAVHKFVLSAQEDTVTVDGVDPNDWLKVSVISSHCSTLCFRKKHQTLKWCRLNFTEKHAVLLMSMCKMYQTYRRQSACGGKVILPAESQ